MIEYTHFAGLFTPVREGPRELYCDRCGHENLAPAGRCEGCGNELADVFRLQAAAGAAAS